MARKKRHIVKRNLIIRRSKDEPRESDSGCSGKKLPQTRKNNNVELDRVTEEAESNSSINSDLSALDRVPKQASVKKKMTTETNLEAIMSDCHEAEIETDENVTLEFDKENHDPEISQQEIKENPEKRMKMESKKMLELKTQDKKASAVIERCQYCKQKLNNDIKLYQGHPNGAVEEEIALTDPKLCLFIGDESFIDESDERPQNKLTHFSVYDMNGHLCPFDAGLIEKNVLLYFSGYMKAIFEENSSPEGGIPTKDMGPINEWYVTGFDGGELVLVGFSTACAEYILMEPSETYAPFMDAVKEKIYMSKLVIEFLLDEINPTYEDLLNKLQTVVPPKETMTFTEDTLLRHAQFICDRVLSLDNCAGIEDTLLITAPCMRSLMKLSGVTLGKKSAVRLLRRAPKVKMPAWSMATTTKLVNNMFENIFAGQLAKNNNNNNNKLLKRRRCGVCENCQQPECGICPTCKDMTKFGGKGVQKQACIKRRCPNLAIQEADDSDEEQYENEEQYESLVEDQMVQESKNEDFKELKKDIVWEEENKIVDAQKTYYKSVTVGNEKIEINDYVLLEPRDPTIPLQICKVVFMWETKNGEKRFHANRLRRGTDTILGETSDPIELFLSDQCCEASFTSIRSKATVIHKKMPENWSELGNMDTDNYIKDTDGKTFFYKLKYDPESARFEDPPPDPECPGKQISHRFCPSCIRLAILTQQDIPKVYNQIEVKSSKEVIYELVKYKGEEYKVGSAVFLYPKAFMFEYKRKYQEFKNSKMSYVDEDTYPEFYKKTDDKSSFSNVDTPEPFHIGYINTIYATTTDILVAPTDIFIKVNKMYRPENTHRDIALMEQSDINMVYWSNEICTVNFSVVAGKCYLAYFKNMSESIEEWSIGGSNRFYFTEAYNPKEKTFDEPPYDIINTSKSGKGKGKCKSTKKVERTEKKQVIETPINYPTISRKLRMLDIFAGCGGLSEGMHQAGVAESLWAIEKESSAANAYRLNNPKTIVFSEDCNKLLQRVMDGERVDNNGQKLPQKGDVELLCGGPPCQGFSGMNRFNLRQYSLFKNSLIVTFLSYCDYYRPKFFVMENVRNFVFCKKSMVLKLTLRCLIRMGYQCTFGILQAGSYGVPQTRRRMILLAAAPGEILPKYPIPTHVFSKRCCSLSVIVDSKRYITNCVRKEFAPYRAITVKDALYDLPEIKCGSNVEEISYVGEPITHFQRKMRGKPYQSRLTDHICKEMSPLVEARMSYIPTTNGSDWRDLPNIVVQLSDGTYTKKLEYMHNDTRIGKSSTNAFRGVCSCSSGQPCDPTDKQFNTLIPWCLPHTASRHNNWKGLYGRIEWNGFFSTTITNPEPMGKQGRVLHPIQNRVVSVRECARSQGFLDSYRFFGTITDKHRQVGNAVPPPLAAAIGHEIRKCIRNMTLNIEPKPANNCSAEATTSKNLDNSFNESLNESHNEDDENIIKT
ncbi:DNA (cytosine-5)-methyltransferase PliMCI [Trachymyrmex zeteki]|uniref:DNA (cytosine-5)-methyltransferase n=1 Tax=Mycetomoellerius zeteki TaxID=64791 RepID=A0A151WVE7_9HYME|nr:PREDICTED: DNA (cytosine-5)-methyltransferase PliMCI-like [Trachymyrmex zeteki]KYQ51853.1 DNA (cytosine-5)-methyltransferase PliMCI [Trachymyrmex zeteki]